VMTLPLHDAHDGNHRTPGSGDQTILSTVRG
jgi:hypothetical protein